MECTDNDTSTWIAFLYILITGVKIVGFLFGPLWLQWVFHSESIRTTDYIIKLKDKLVKTILVKKVRIPDDSGRKPKEMKQFKKFRRIVKTIPSEEIVPVSYEKLQIQVDQRRLMSEKSVPVGLFHFLYENLFRCRIRYCDPFGTCCTESIFGSWSQYFLWLPLKKNSECNNSTRNYLSWGHIFVIVGGMLILLAIPLPYYVRVGIYFAYESDEIDSRKEALEAVGLRQEYNHNILHLVSPTHAGMILVYITYILTFLILAAFRECNSIKFDEIAVTAVQDLRNIYRSECLLLLAAHLVLPFEKFGLCGGLLVGMIYWPIALPICLLVGIAYCIPTIYLTGRFLIQSRPAFLYLKPQPTSTMGFNPSRYNRRHLSNGTSSFETCMLLENISPSNDLDNAELDKTKMTCCKCHLDRHRMYTTCLSWVIGLLCICLMYSVLVMFAEVYGFVLEIFVFTLMGAIVNAGIAARYVMLAFWIIMYSTACYNQVYEKYMALNKRIFDCIKSQLGNDIRVVTLLREEKQRNTAFKYFSTAELQEQAQEDMALEVDSDDEYDEQTAMIKREQKLILPADNIEYVKDKLHWRINTLVFFVDSKDKPRIPKELFEKICMIQAPGCPGPVYLSLLRATRQLIYMIIFLLFVLIVVMAFGDIYNISTTNQLLVTLAGGFVPWVVRFVIQPKKHAIALGTYSFEGKIHHIIRTFSQLWPVYDMSFTKVEETGESPGEEAPGTTHEGPPEGHTSPVVDPGVRDDRMEGDNTATLLLPGRQPTAIEPKKDLTHVDLLITIRDDCDDDIGANLRSEAVSHGSRASLNSANRPSPEEVHLVGLNNPQASNALRRTISTPSEAQNEARRRVPGPTVGTQTGNPASFGQVSPSNRPVDLMVDMVKGNVRVRNTDPDNGNGISGNGSPPWTQDSPYNRMARDESESSV